MGVAPGVLMRAIRCMIALSFSGINFDRLFCIAAGVGSLSFCGDGTVLLLRCVRATADGVLDLISRLSGSGDMGLCRDCALRATDF